MPRQKRFGLLAAFVTLLILTTAWPALAEEDSGSVTNENSGQTYNSITEAVEEAGDGDVLLVGAGSYEESVVISKALTIKGEPGAVIEGVEDYAVSIQAPGVALTGLTIHSGSTCAVEVNYDKISSENPVSWSITNCRISGGEKARAGIHVCGEIASPSTILIENNVIEHYFAGIDFASSYSDNGPGSVIEGLDLTVKNNEIKNVVIALAFYDLEVSSITVEKNFIDATADGTPEERFGLLVNQCWDCNFRLSRNEVTGVMGFFFFYCYNSTVEIHGNTFDVDDFAVSFYRNIADAEVAILDNTILLGDENIPGPLNGIFFQISSGEISIANNSIESNASDAAGINVWVAEEEESWESGSSLESLDQAAGAKGAALNGAALASAVGGAVNINIEDNRASGLTYGIALYVSEAMENRCSAAIHANVLQDNKHGLSLDLTLNHSDSAIEIFNNLIHQNEHGLLIEKLAGDFVNKVKAFCNSFTGNAVAGINNSVEGVTFNAPLNWWGAAAGPSTEGNETSGDAVEGAVNYGPWLKELKLSTSGSKLADGGENTVRATLLDSEGNLVDTDLLAVLFTVTGANNLSEVVQLDGGIATFSYRDRSPGTDTISANLLFAGETAGDNLDMESVAQTSWVKAAGGDEEEEDEDYRQREMPRTGAAGSMLPAAIGLASLLAGAALRLWRRNGANLSGNR